MTDGSSNIDFMFDLRIHLEVTSTLSAAWNCCSFQTSVIIALIRYIIISNNTNNICIETEQLSLYWRMTLMEYHPQDAEETEIMLEHDWLQFHFGIR